MTRLQTALPRACVPPGLLASASLAAMSTNFQRANADPKAIDAGKPPRDLADTYKSLNLAGHPGAVYVLVSDYTLNDAAMTTAMKLVVGSTMNGRYIDDAAAKKLLADDMAGTLNIDQCLGNGVAISHHREPRRVAGIPRNRGEHVAVH